MRRSSTGLRAAGLPEDAIQLVPTRDRAAVGLMLAGLDGAIDVIVPRGGKGLVARVQAEARVPVFAHLDGNCHVYVDKAADLDMAKRIVLNAKMRRTGVCGAAETLLVDRAAAQADLAPLVAMLLDAGCEVRGDRDTQAVDARVTPATEEDWRTEFLDAIIAVKVVDGVDGAIAHIERYGSHHTDAIVTAGRGGRRTSSCARSIRRSCCTMPRPSSPTAASSASAPRSASPPAACMRAARSAPSSSRRSSIASSAPVRRARDPPSSARSRACGSACSAAPSIRRTARISPPACSRMTRLKLDRVWWLVTPGNPLKDTRGLAPLAERIAAAKALTHHPRIDITGFEAELGVRYSYDTVSYLVQRCPGVRFVWIMGADNLRSFHRWQKWRGIARLIPMAVVDRLGPEPLFGRQRRRAGARARAHPRISCRQSLADRRPPAWVFLHGLKSPLSSTALRARAPTERSQNCRRNRRNSSMSRAPKGSPGRGRRAGAGHADQARNMSVVDSVNRSHICLSVGPGQGARGSSNRKEGPLSTPAVSRAGIRRRPAPVSKVQIDTRGDASPRPRAPRRYEGRGHHHHRSPWQIRDRRLHGCDLR